VCFVSGNGRANAAFDAAHCSSIASHRKVGGSHEGTKPGSGLQVSPPARAFRGRKIIMPQKYLPCKTASARSINGSGACARPSACPPPHGLEGGTVAGFSTGRVNYLNNYLNQRGAARHVFLGEKLQSWLQATVVVLRKRRLETGEVTANPSSHAPRFVRYLFAPGFLARKGRDPAEK
jgi:hypothetical protein